MLTPNFICPICQSSLILNEKTWHCTAQNDQNRSHSFDVAKQGYINLLPVQHKKSKNPGDSEDAIQARQRFLQAGFYQPLRQKIVEMAKAIVKETENCYKAGERNFTSSTVSKSNILANADFEDYMLPNNATWLDIGCGEGFYTQGLLTLNPTNLIALDISKPAVIATARALKHSDIKTFSIVASASQVPLASHSVNVISSIFSPILPQEFARLVGEKGLVLIAKPAVKHLIQLREGLFDEVLPHDSDKFIDELSPLFALKQQQEIVYEIQVTAEQLADLLTMTPYSYRAKPEKRQAVLTKVSGQGPMTLTVNFVVYAFEKVVKID